MIHVARILKVEKDNIRKWSHIFSEFLSPKSKSVDGSPMLFNTNDLAVLSYVNVYWELEPDIESIKLCIQAEEHLDFPFYEIIQQAAPIFIDPPENIEELASEETVLFGGLSRFGDWHQLAKAYKHAGDLLVNSAIDNHSGYELICPIIYNYRHATELFLKSTLQVSDDMLKKEIGHNLVKATNIFEHNIKEKFNEDLPEWFKNIIIAFNDFDRNGETFRYGNLESSDEMFIDLRHLKGKMAWLQEIFERIELQDS